jgi:hypothetical protein
VVEPERIDETLQLARRGLAPTSAERERLRAAIAARAARPGGSAESSAGEAPRGWSALKASGASGLAAGVVLLALGFAGGLLLGRQRDVPAPAPAPAAAAATTVTATASASVAEVSVPAPPVEREQRVPAPAKPRPRASAARSDAFERELALLQRAERALRSEDPALALSLLSELERDHPRAALAEERRAARVMANCQAREPTAPLAAERFLREAPDSVYTDRVRTLCGLADGERPAER